MVSTVPSHGISRGSNPLRDANFCGVEPNPFWATNLKGVYFFIDIYNIFYISYIKMNNKFDILFWIFFVASCIYSTIYATYKILKPLF